MTDPLFIIGCPRSGTTILLDLVAGTGAFGYVNNETRRDPNDPTLHAANRTYDLPLVGGGLYRHRRRILGAAKRIPPLHAVARQRLSNPIEPWEFWERLIPTFRPEFGVGRAIDPSIAGIDDTVAADTRAVVADLLRRQQRTQLLSKYTDFPRVDLMRRIFPQARFVHIERDPHAVTNSYAREMETGRFGTWRYRDWWSAEWTEGARHHWHTHGSTILGFAAHNRNRLIGLVRDAVDDDPFSMTISYESLMASPVETLERLLRFADAEPRHDLERLCASRRLSNTNDRWRSQRTAEEATLLDDVIHAAHQRGVLT